MKKILLLSSILFIFLFACGNVEISIPATHTSTLAPPATATVQPATPTEAPMTTATAKPIDWAAATDAEKLAAAPKIEGLTPNVSPNPYHPNDIIYRDAVTGEAIKAVDLTTRNEIALQDAGIIKPPQNGTPPAGMTQPDRTPLELLYFDENNVVNGLRLIQETAFWMPERKLDSVMTYKDDATNRFILNKLYLVPGFGHEIGINYGVLFPNVGDTCFVMESYHDINGRMYMVFKKENKEMSAVYFDVDSETFAQIIEKFKFAP